SHRLRLRSKERANVVAESTIPLLPAVPDKTADLVQASGVPSLGNELRARQRRIGLDVPQDRRVCKRTTRWIARQNRREIEAEPVHMHFLDPVAQAVHDHPTHDWM